MLYYILSFSTRACVCVHFFPGGLDEYVLLYTRVNTVQSLEHESSMCAVCRVQPSNLPTFQFTVLFPIPFSVPDFHLQYPNPLSKSQCPSLRESW